MTMTDTPKPTDRFPDRLPPYLGGPLHDPGPTPPEREGVVWEPPTAERVDVVMALAEDFRAAEGKQQYAETYKALRAFLTEMVTNLTEAIASPAPAHATGEVERPSSAQVHAAADVHRGYVNLDHQPDDYPDHVDIAEAMLEAALACPAELIVPDDVTTLTFRHGHLPHARWMVVLKAKNPEDDNIRMGWGETAEDALAHARSKRDAS